MAGSFWRLVFPFILVLACLGLGTWGFLGSEIVSAGEPIELTAGEAFWLASGLPVLETTNYPGHGSKISLPLNLARAIGLFIPPYAFFIILSSLVGDRLKYIRIWWWRIASSRPSVLVFGVGWIGSELVEDLAENYDYNVVAVERDRNAFERTAHRRRTVFIEADATSQAVLRRLGVDSAHRVYVVCNSDETNCWIADQVAAIREVAGQEADVPVCYVHILDSRKRFHVSRMRISVATHLNVNCFNVFETTSRRLYFDEPNYRFPATIADGGLDGGLDESIDRSIRIIIMGDTPMGRAMLLQCLQTGHFRRPQKQEIIVVAEDAEACERAFLEEYPIFAPDFVGGSPELQRLVDYVFPGATDRPIRFDSLPVSDAELLSSEFARPDKLGADYATSLYVCLDDGLRSAAYATIMAEKLENMIPELEIDGTDYKIYLYYNIPREQQMEQVSRLREFLSQTKSDGATRIPFCVFGDLMENCSVSVVEADELDRLARRIASRFAGIEGDASEHSHWNMVEEEIRQSNRHAADHAAVKLGCFALEVLPGHRVEAERAVVDRVVDRHLEDLAEMEHRRWCAHMLLDGALPLIGEDAIRRWDTEGEDLYRQRKQAQKIHRCLVPYDELPEAEVRKKLQQIREIPDLLASIDAYSDSSTTDATRDSDVAEQA
jgi:hypothetical protein